MEDGVRPYAASIFAWGRKQPGADLIDVSREKMVQILLPRTEADLALWIKSQWHEIPCRGLYGRIFEGRRCSSGL